MTPYYEDSHVKIYHDDFRALDIKAELCIADPPFNIWKDVAQSVSLIEYKTMAVFTNWQNREFLSPLGRPHTEMIWIFDDGRWVSHRLPRINHETILIYGETGDAYVGRSMAGISSQKKGKGSVGKDKMPERTWVPRERALLNSYFAYARNVRSGVWSKPLPMITQLIEWLSLPDETIFDPFMGSGTVLIAAKSLNRKAIGCDISESQCEIAANKCMELI